MKPWHQRTLYRALFASLLVFLATLKASIGDGLSDQEIIELIYVPLIAFGGWYGIGAIPGSPTEPFLNNSNPGSVDVPVPPADQEPAQP